MVTDMSMLVSSESSSEEWDYAVEYLYTYIVLGHQRQPVYAALSIEDYDAIVVDCEARVFSRDVVGDDHVEVLGQQL